MKRGVWMKTYIQKTYIYLKVGVGDHPFPFRHKEK
jgi:hypothetical protein